MFSRKRTARLVYEQLSRRPAVVTAAVRIRNVTNALVGHSLVFGHDPLLNGEAKLAREVLPDAHLVFDVGANVGDWSALALAALAPTSRLVCFEPSSSACRRLQARYAADDRVEIVQAALSDTVGEATFYEEPNAGEASSFLFANTRGDATAGQVRLTTIDEELEHRGVSHVDMVKIDAEGFDLQVLRGAEGSLRAGAIGVITFEYNEPWAHAGATLGAAVGLLAQHGYEVKAVTPDGPKPFRYERFGETFTYANFVAFRPGSAGATDLDVMGGPERRGGSGPMH